MIVSILVFLIIFSVIVIGHEFGHYSVAVRNGIRVREFDIGMGPLLYKKRRGETDFCIRALPFGGACMYDGVTGLETEEEKEMIAQDEHAFPNAPVFARIATVFAGPFANFLLGFVFALIIVAFSGTDLPVIQEIMENSAAEAAGLKAGDTIRRINGEHIHLYREVSMASSFNRGEEMTIEYIRDGKRYSTTLTPRFHEEDGRYLIGLRGSGEFVRTNALQAFQYGFYETTYWVKATVKSLRQMFTGGFHRDDLSGPIGMVKAVDDTYDAARPYGVWVTILSFLNLATLLTVNLGIMNLLPIPALDGGRLIFLFIEAIRGKPVSPEKEGYVHLAGIAALLVLMAFVMFNDITRFFR
ncbi:MAG: RIP metalloprotease RseP [Lachnospiraceae bacterium]|nr:RIP metalloprotease RseP [Lachnospiraceae bacterium]